MAAQTKVKVTLTMLVPTVDPQAAGKMALDALIKSGCFSLVAKFGASIQNAEVLEEDPDATIS